MSSHDKHVERAAVTSSCWCEELLDSHSENEMSQCLRFVFAGGGGVVDDADNTDDDADDDGDVVDADDYAVDAGVVFCL